MEIKVNEIINWFHSDYKDVLVRVHRVNGNTLEDCFHKVYAMKRSGRYDSARRYDFDDPSLYEKYIDWESKNETFEMYYGSGTVD